MANPIGQTTLAPLSEGGDLAAMNTALGSLETAFSRISTVEFHRRALLTALTQNRSSEVDAYNRVMIPRSTYGKVAAGTGKTQDSYAYDRDGDEWIADPPGVENTWLQLQVDKRIQSGRSMFYLDRIETHLPYVDRMLQRINIDLTTLLEDKYWTFLSADANYTPKPASGTAPQLLDRDDAKSGTNVNIKVAQGNKPGDLDDVGEAIWDAINDFIIYLVKLDAWGPSAGMSIGGMGLGMPYCAMRPEVFRVLKDYLLSKRYSLDPLTDSALRENSIFGRGAFQGFLSQLPIFSTTAIPEPAAGGKWYIQMGTSEANALAMRPPLTQILEPSIRQDKYRWRVNTVWWYGFAIVNPQLNYRASIPAVA